MDFTHRLAISYYKTIAVINEDHNIFLVQHQETGKIYIKKIILFLVNECLLKNSTSSLLKNIYNYLTSTNSSSFESILDFLIDVLICYCINDISIFIQMKSMLDNQSNSKALYDELKAKIESSIDIFNYFFFTYTVSRTQNKYLIYIIIILSLYHYINKDKAFSEVCKFINFRHQNNLDFLIKKMSSNRSGDVVAVDSLARVYAIRYYDNSQDWMDASELAKDFNTDYITMLSHLKNNYISIDNGDMSDIKTAYVREIKKSGVAPFEYCQERIKEYILSERKRELLVNLERSLLDGASDRGIFVIY